LKNLFKSQEKNSNNVKLIEGYYYNDKIADSASIANFEPIYSFENTTVSVENIKKSLHLLSGLCAKNNALLIAVRAPYPPSRLKISRTDTAHAFFKKLYPEEQIPFYDFNYLGGFDYYDQDFTDYHHMNVNGANKVSAELGQIIMEHLESNNATE
jgi:lysophospholipase L1-like esterase